MKNKAAILTRRATTCLLLWSCCHSSLPLARSMASSTTNRPLENVWDYPRPAVLEPIEDEVRIVFDGVEVCRTTQAMRILETSHPPTYYVPLSSINTDLMALEPAGGGGGGSFCEWKGRAVYYDLVSKTNTKKRSQGAAWAYPNPTKKVNPGQAHGWENYGSGTSSGTGGSFGPIANMVAFYGSRVDECYVAGEKSKPQDGGFYGGWINSWITGGKRGIKGAPGTSYF